jgi:PAS domain-containing protein
MIRTTRSLLLRYGGALVFTAAAVILGWLLNSVVGDYLPLATLYGAVAFATWLGGYRPALLAVVLGYFASDYLFIEPRGTVLRLDVRNLAGLILYLFACAIIIGFGEAMHAARRRLEIRQRELEQAVAQLRCAEEESRQRKEDNEIVTDSMAAPVTRCSRDLKYVWVSKPYADWINRPASEITGRPILDIIGQEAFTHLRPHFEQVLSGQVVRYEEQIQFRGIGPRWISAVYTPTLDANGLPDGWVAVVLDVTERKRMEESVRLNWRGRLGFTPSAPVCCRRTTSRRPWTTFWRTPSRRPQRTSATFNFTTPKLVRWRLWPSEASGRTSSTVSVRVLWKKARRVHRP